MKQQSIIAKLQDSADCRVCFTIIGFVYSPLLLLLGAAAMLGSG